MLPYYLLHSIVNISVVIATLGPPVAIDVPWNVLAEYDPVRLYVGRVYVLPLHILVSSKMATAQPEEETRKS